jgi:hypothetical protein
MDGNSPASLQNSKPRFLANINSDDSLRKSTNLLEEILGTKLDKLKAQKAVKDSAQQAGNVSTRLHETKVVEDRRSISPKPNQQTEKADDTVSIQVRPKTSPRQSDPSDSQLGSLMSGSLQKKVKGTEKDQVNVTTQDGLRSDKNSEVFDIRVFKVPNGRRQPLDSLSQQSENREKANKGEDEDSPDINPFENGLQADSLEKDQNKSDFRRSVTEAIPQENRAVPELAQSNHQEERSPSNQFTAKTRRTPTDIHMETARKNNLQSRDKNDSRFGMQTLGGYKMSPMKTEAEQKTYKAASSRNKVFPSSSGRAMLEFSDPMNGPISTENVFLPDAERPKQDKTAALSSKDRGNSNKEQPSSADIKKSCLKKDGKAQYPAVPNLDDDQSHRNFALASPQGSKKGILTNKGRVAPFDMSGVVDGGIIPVKRSNTQMSKASRKSPTRVKFAERPIIYEVQSYKKYYKEQYDEKEYCSRCSLI